LQPLLVVALGAVAFEALCPDEIAAGVRFSQAIGEITRSKRYDVPVFPIYHPSPLNLNGEGRLAMFKRHMYLMCGLVRKLKERHPDAGAPVRTGD
jgi:uracil-DNA glycosylase